MQSDVSIKGLRSRILVFRLDIQLEQEYDNPVCKTNWLQVAKYDESYTVFFSN